MADETLPVCQSWYLCKSEPCTYPSLYVQVFRRPAISRETKEAIRVSDKRLPQQLSSRLRFCCSRSSTSALDGRFRYTDHANIMITRSHVLQFAYRDHSSESISWSDLLRPQPASERLPIAKAPNQCLDGISPFELRLAIYNAARTYDTNSRVGASLNIPSCQYRGTQLYTLRLHLIEIAEYSREAFRCS